MRTIILFQNRNRKGVIFMRKVMVLALVLCCFVGFASADGLEPLMAPGDLAVSAGVGYGFLWGAIDVAGGVEYMLGQFKIADTIPLTYGAAAKASYYSWNGGTTDWHDAYLGGGAFATLHLGLKDLSLPDNLGFLENVDTYIGLGVGFYSWTSGWTGSTSSEFKLGIRSTGGVNYFITPKIAIVTEGGYYGYYSSGLLGILFKL
jgi:hypothetical protein